MVPFEEVTVTEWCRILVAEVATSGEGKAEVALEEMTPHTRGVMDGGGSAAGAAHARGNRRRDEAARIGGTVLLEVRGGQARLGVVRASCEPFRHQRMGPKWVEGSPGPDWHGDQAAAYSYARARRQVIVGVHGGSRTCGPRHI